MKYFVLRSASQRTKAITSFALTLVMVFQVLGPGVLVARAQDNQDHPKIYVCQEDGDGHWHENQVDQQDWNNHHDSHDFQSTGDHGHNDGDNHQGDNWCKDNIPPPPTGSPCITPVTVNSGDKITSFGVSSDGISLQQVLDTAYPPAGTINTTTQETGIQSWNIPAGTNSVTFSGKFIAAYAGNSQEFGYYFDGNLSTYTPVFRNSASHNGTAPILAPGAVIPSFTVNTSGHTTIGFALDTQGTSPARYATEKSLNALGEDHAVVYTNPNNAKGYVFAFEDLPFTGGSDKDYQDLVLELNVDSCSNGSQCTPSTGTVSSDTTTQVTAINPTGPSVPFNAFLVTPTTVTTTYWTAVSTDPNAKWIWSEDPVTGWTVDKTVTFTKTFNITGSPSAITGSLQVAADNNYSVSVNGTAVDTNVLNSFSGTIHTYDVSADLHSGSNTVTFIVINTGQAGDAVSNPGGLLYSLSWSATCGNNGGGGGSGGGSNVQVHIAKYLDGVQATAVNANNYAFPMTATWNATNIGSGSGTYTLSPTPFGPSGDLTVGPYQADTAYMTNGATYSTQEITNDADASSKVLPHGAACIPGDYELDGYGVSDISIADAWAHVVAPSGPSDHPSFGTGINHDKYVVVANHTCPTSAHIVVSKIICPNESELPNWGLGSGPAITSTTASGFLANHKDCQLNTDWQFQWGPSTSTDPGGAITGSASAPWSSAFSGSIDVPVASASGSIHMREVLQTGYIPFTYDAASTTPNGNNYSAEFYCNADHLNYDNFDFINSPVAGQTYYCVAWNVSTNIPPATVKVTIDKFINGVPATAAANSANGNAFPMSATWTAANLSGGVQGTGTYDLASTGFNSPNAYEAVTSDMTTGADYSTNEVTGGNIVANTCDNSGQPFAFVGYSTGDTHAAAASSTVSTTVPAFTGLTSDKYVIVWNKTCTHGGGGNPGETFDYATTTIKAADLDTNGPSPAAVATDGLNKWFMYNDTNDTIDNTLGSFVTGPGTPPIGVGSVEFTLGASPLDRKNIATYQYSGTALSAIKALRFSSYSHSGVAGATESPYLAFNVDFTGSSGSFQRRLVYVPSNNGAVPQDTWNMNDAYNGGNAKYVYSGASWPAPLAGPNIGVTGVSGATTKTWSQILIDYPSARVLPLGGWMGVRVGEPGPTNYTGDIDAFVIAIKTGTNTHTQTYDFEPTHEVAGCDTNCPSTNVVVGGGGGNSGNVPGSGFGSGGHFSGFSQVAGASTGNGGGQVLGATTDVPGLPNTGDGQQSQTLTVTLALVAALIGINMFVLRSTVAGKNSR